MTYRILLNIIFIFLCLHSFSQEKLNPERPSESKTPELVKGNNLQIEAGLKKERVTEHQYEYNHPELLVRYGLFNALELRMEMVSQTTKDNVTKENLSGLIPVYFGVKAKILPEYKWLPSIGASADIGVPSLASSDYSIDGIPFQFRTLFNNNITSKFSVQYNVGVAWNETNNQKDNKQWMYSFNPTYEITDNFHVFVEEYAFLRNGTGAEHYFDGGLQYFFNKDLVVDVSGGVGLSNNSSDYFVKGGFAYRISFSGKN
ncbi:MAG TPA: transporter [Flavitalea sp.]|nr:transporter [Flavitalea sp.]